MLTVIFGIMAVLVGIALLIAIPLCAGVAIVWALWKAIIVVVAIVLLVKLVNFFTKK